MLKDGDRTVGARGASFGSGGMTRGGERGVAGTAGQGLVWPTRIVRRATVTELYQNPIYLAEKGINFERKQNPRKRVNDWREKG